MWYSTGIGRSYKHEFSHNKIRGLDSGSFTGLRKKKKRRIVKNKKGGSK